ncbi:MAG: hypothetical protein JWM27_1511 [Gemmatimonadetes bacterium]|nr:hypothetical protein [Gemmatimonadota bacterium]
MTYGRTIRRILLGLAPALPAALAAQSPTYRHAPGDSLRYRAVTTARAEFALPTGAVPVGQSRDATLTLRFGRGDTVRAVFRSLRQSSTGPGGESTVETDSALGKPFILRLEANGALRMLSMPHLPAALAEATDFEKAFTDFLIRMPGTPLRAGATWTDSTVMGDSLAAGVDLVSREVLRYRVVGDTTVAGRTLVKVEFAGTSYRRSSVAGGVLRLSGPVTGRFLWDAAAGRLAARRRAGHFVGRLAVATAAGSGEVPATMEMESTLTLLP